jgi:ribosomal protein L29
MTNQELTSLSDEQLVHKEIELERALMGHTFRHRLGQLENTSTLGKARRDIARAQTELGVRERTGGLQRGSLRARHRGTFVVTAPESATAGVGDDFLKGILDKQEATE